MSLGPAWLVAAETACADIFGVGGDDFVIAHLLF
jgi:hypothetical protein